MSTDENKTKTRVILCTNVAHKSVINDKGFRLFFIIDNFKHFFSFPCGFYRAMRQRLHIKIYFFSALFQVCFSALKKDRSQSLKWFVFVSVQSPLRKRFSIHNSTRVIIKPPVNAVLEHKFCEANNRKTAKFPCLYSSRFIHFQNAAQLARNKCFTSTMTNRWEV